MARKTKRNYTEATRKRIHKIQKKQLNIVEIYHETPIIADQINCEIWFHIFEKLDIQTLLKCRLANKYFDSIIYEVIKSSAVSHPYKYHLLSTIDNNIKYYDANNHIFPTEHMLKYFLLSYVFQRNYPTFTTKIKLSNNSDKLTDIGLLIGISIPKEEIEHVLIGQKNNPIRVSGENFESGTLSIGHFKFNNILRYLPDKTRPGQDTIDFKFMFKNRPNVDTSDWKIVFQRVDIHPQVKEESSNSPTNHSLP